MELEFNPSALVKSFKRPLLHMYFYRNFLYEHKNARAILVQYRTTVNQRNPNVPKNNPNVRTQNQEAPCPNTCINKV